MRLKLLSCEILRREMSAAVARSPHQIDVEFLDQELNGIACGRLHRQLQKIVDRVDPSRYSAIILGYSLCGNGIVGLESRTLRLVIPRAQDCVGLLLGGQKRYEELVQINPQVVYRSTGWLERSAGEYDGEEIERPGGYTLDELICRYGEEKGQAMFDEMSAFPHMYKQLTFIETGAEPDGSFEKKAREEAHRRGWRFSKVLGNMSLLDKLVCGDWTSEDFIVLQPGHRVGRRDEAGLLSSEPITR